jgi:hypothetical protein
VVHDRLDGPLSAGNAQGGQWAWNNRDVTQNQNNQEVAPGFEPLAKAVAMILKQLPAFGLNPEDQQDIEEAANAVLAEVQQPQPEPRRIRRVLAAIEGFLMPLAVEAAREEVRDLAQHGLDQINAAF